MLSDRRQLVLRALIEEYVARALPVGSRTIVEHYRLGVSPATVRNDLSALEDAGYISQPHTSAGRIPTDAGYRAFVDDLIAKGIASEEHPHENVVSQLRASAEALDDLMEKTSAELTRLTDCLSVVTSPSVLMTNIRQISLISLTNFRAIIVIVADDGQIVNHQISFSEETSPDELLQIQELLSRLFVGKSFQELRAAVDAEAIEALSNPKARFVLEEIINCMKDSGIGRTSRVGLSSLMRMPEFQETSTLLPLMEILEDDTVLFRAFDSNGPTDGEVTIRIGRENATEELAGVSVIAGTYGRGEAQGLVAVIGPTRMDYTRVIRAVRAAQNALGDE